MTGPAGGVTCLAGLVLLPARTAALRLEPVALLCGAVMLSVATDEVL